MANLDAFTAERLLNGEAANPALEGFLEALRTPSHPTELIAEREVVAKMIEGFKQAAPSAGRGSKSARRFTRRVATGAAVAVLSLGGVAAAATGVNPFSPLIDGSPDPSLETVSSTDASTTTLPNESTTTTSTTTTRSATSSSPTTESDKDSSPSTSIECADGNHGKTVSSIAKANTPGRPESPGDNHGATVREAAKSDCGKEDSEDEDDDAEQEKASTTTAAAASDGSTTTAAKPTRPEAGNGNGNGKGAGNTERGK